MKDRKANYCVETSTSLPRLVEQVNEMLALGYELVGGICTSNDEGILNYHQAMKKEN